MTNSLWGALLLCGLLVSASCSRDNTHPDLPYGAVDTPAASGTVTGKVMVAGWALADDGIESVSIYVDRKFASAGQTGAPRPDVQKIYPKMPASGNAGWSALLDTGAFSPGWHELTVQVRSKSGATRDLAPLSVLVQRGSP